MTYIARWAKRWLPLCLLALGGGGLLAAQQHPSPSSTAEPPAATGQAHPVTDAQEAGNPQPPDNCAVRNVGASMAATAEVRAMQVDDAAGAAAQPANPPVVGITLCVPHMPLINWYARFLNGPQVKALTPLEKAHLAARNLIDPYNLITIAGESAIAVAFNAHSPEGPGMHGLANSMGVSFTQDMVGEFFGTFLIPSLTHEDPHYHRMPGAGIKRRVIHCITQIAWTEGDNGRGMPNYSNLAGFAVEEEVNDLYVPGQETNLRASTERYGTALATAPVDNFITEFLPDIASHIHVRVFLVQRIVNQVARTESGSSTP